MEQETYQSTIKLREKTENPSKIMEMRVSFCDDSHPNQS